MESERTQEYLEAIYKRQRIEKPVATSILAEDLKVSPPAVTDMLRSLESRGLINYKVNKGAVLTDLGREQAVAVIRRHRLWERFLTDVLGMKWDKVHEEACKLEHVTSPEIEEGLSQVLGNVDTCPHGHSIPDKRGNIKEEGMLPLGKCQAAQPLCIAAIDKEAPALLRKIEKLGLRPGVPLKIVKKNKDGTLDLEAHGEKLSINSEMAGVLLVRPESKIEAQVNTQEIPLSKLTSGHSGIIRSCGSGRSSLGRCLSLGFTPGSMVKMMENFRSGPVLVKVHDTEVALGRGLAEKIIVYPNAKIC
ncbi:MAG: metal-dependent transcriptional regulator [Dehalococcoidia bacterium]|jgi:DtxR family Mn-dependent transcriptional regulator